MITVNNIYHTDCLEGLRSIDNNSVTTVHTSPPYNIGKDYSGYKDSLARKEYLSFVKDAICELHRVIKTGGNLFWQTGYTTFENGYIYPIDHLTFEIFLEAGFRLKDRIIWRYFGGMSFKNKFTNKHETILWWTKPGADTFFDVFPIREKSKELDPRNNLFGRNPGNVWEVDRVAFGSVAQTSHIAVFPEEISDRIVLSTTRLGEICMDPFSGSGTLCKVAKSRGRRFIGFEIAKAYYQESVKRLGFVADSEYKNVLSSLIKLKAFQSDKRNQDLGRIFDFMYHLLSTFDVECTNLFEAIEEYNAFLVKEDILSKRRKIEFWKKTDSFFENKKNDCNVIYILNKCFEDAFKLTSVYNGAMRLYQILHWYNSFRERKDQLYNDICSIVEEEPESYRRKGNTITLVNRHKRIKEDKRIRNQQDSPQTSLITDR